LNLNIFDRLNNNLNDNKNSLVKNFINELNDYLEEKTKGVEVHVSKASQGIGENKIHGYMLYYHDNARQIKSEFKKTEEVLEGLEAHHILRYKNGKYTIDEELSRKELESKRQTDEWSNRIRLEERSEGTDYYIHYKYGNGNDISLGAINLDTGYKFSLENFDLTLEQFQEYDKNDTLTYKNGEFVLKCKNDDVTREIVEQHEQEGAEYYLKSEDRYGFDATNLNTGLDLRVSKFNSAAGFNKELRHGMTVIYKDGNYIVKE